MNTSFPFCSTENGTVKFAVRKCSERSFSFITISSAKNIPMATNWMDEETYKLTDLWSIDAIQAMLCHTLINCFFFFVFDILMKTREFNLLIAKKLIQLWRNICLARAYHKKKAR